ncbi:DUF1254 domain-containing protein [Cupriavidus basilensis]
MIRTESNIAYALYRTQLHDKKDLANVRRIQRGYKVKTLSAFRRNEGARASSADPLASAGAGH